MTADLVRSLSPYLASWLDHQIWCQRIPGLQVAIRVDGELLYSAGHGLADLSSGTKMTPDHLLHIASHSKTYCAVALETLLHDGLLRWDDSVSQHLPEYADTWAGDLTLRELCSHTAGMIRDGKACDHWSLKADFPDSDQLRQVILTEGKQTERAEYFKYSNIGFGLLGEVITAVAGMSFAEYVLTKVVQPLGLTNTYPDYREDLTGPFASCYGAPRGVDYARAEFAQVPTNALAAATGFISTAEDTSAFMASLQPGAEGILTDDQRRRLARVQGTMTKGSDTVQYGLGTITSERAGRKMVGHSGGWTGTLSRSAVDFADGLAVSVIGNSIDAPTTQIYWAILDFLAVAAKGPASWQHKPDSVDLAKFTGRYENPWGITDVVQFGDRLVLLNPNSISVDAEELSVLNDTTVRMKAEDTFGGNCEDVVFTFDPDGGASVRMGGEKHVRIARW